MTELLSLTNAASDGQAARAVEVLETGGVVLLPDTPFVIAPQEYALLDPTVLERGVKNVSLDAAGRLGGVALEGEPRALMAAMIARYAAFADATIDRIAPSYAAARDRRRTSYRPGAVETRVLSPRKDDRRLHVNAFPSSPVAGRRILRVFSNVDPSGASRTWRVGADDFASFALEFRSTLQHRSAVVRRILAAAGVTRGYRTDYDQAMLELHDAAKCDDAWQSRARFTSIDFPANSSWIVYTDSVLHAAISGRHAFEQTYLLAVGAMKSPEQAPVRILERLLGSRLV